MSQNTFKVKGGGTGESKGFFSVLEGFRISTLFNDGIPAKYIPHVVFLTIMGIFYIGNTHMAEKTIRDIEKLETEVEELRADFTSLKADYMFTGKQSEVAKKVSAIGLKESKTPPNKIIIE
jgi:hypothetical protein